MRATNVATLGIGLAAGATIGAISAIRAEDAGSSTVPGLLVGAGVGVGGGLLAKVAYRPFMTGASHGVNLLGVGALGAGVGAVVGGAIAGALHERSPERAIVEHDGAAPPEVGTPSTPPAGGGDGGIVIPAVETDVATNMRALQGNAWVMGHTTAQDRALLAAGAVHAGVSIDAAITTMRGIASDEWVGQSYGTLDQAQLAVAAMEANRTGAEAATTMVNVDGTVDETGTFGLQDGEQLTIDIEDAGQRAELAAAAIRGGATGADAAVAYATVRYGLGLDVANSVKLATAALEAGATPEAAVASFRAVSDGSKLSVSDRATLAAADVHANSTAPNGSQAAKDFADFAKDPFVAQLLASGELTSDQAARVVAAGIRANVTGAQSALTFSNALANENVWNAKQNFEQAVDLAIGAIGNYRTGDEAARALRTISQPGAATAKLSPTARFELAGAALSGSSPVSDIVAAYGAARSDRTFTAGTTKPQDALLATATAGVFDASADSEFADWYATAGR